MEIKPAWRMILHLGTGGSRDCSTWISKDTVEVEIEGDIGALKTSHVLGMTSTQSLLPEKLGEGLEILVLGLPQLRPPF